jgi:hypothetical protein
MYKPKLKILKKVYKFKTSINNIKITQFLSYHKFVNQNKISTKQP